MTFTLRFKSPLSHYIQNPEKCCLYGEEEIHEEEESHFPVAEHCEQHAMKQYRYDTWFYYHYHQTNPRMFREYGRGLVQHYEFRQECPPAFLVNLLINIEETLGLRPIQTTFDKMGNYVKLLHDMVKTGEVTSQDFKDWPIQEAWDSVRKTAPVMNKHNEFVASYKMRKKTIEIVFAYCKETKKSIERWLIHTFSRLVWVSLKVTVIMKCGDTPEKRKMHHELFNTTAGVSFVNVDDFEIQGDECSGNFGYVAQRYHTLSDWTLFIHPDASTHIMLIDEVWFDSFVMGEKDLLDSPAVTINQDWIEYHKRLAEKRKGIKRKQLLTTSGERMITKFQDDHDNFVNPMPELPEEEVIVTGGKYATFLNEDGKPISEMTDEEKEKEKKKEEMITRRMAQKGEGMIGLEETNSGMENLEVTVSEARGGLTHSTSIEAITNKKITQDPEALQGIDDVLSIEEPEKYVRTQPIPTQNILEAAMRTALFGNVEDMFGYQVLGGNRDSSEYEYEVAGQLYRRLLNTNVDPPAEPNSYCCSHFLLSREQIQKRPRSFYQAAHDKFMSKEFYTFKPFPNPLRIDVIGRYACQTMMKFWHVVFGHPEVKMPLRHRDPTVPFVLKGRNFKSSYQDE